jgi:hypothetical protein
VNDSREEDNWIVTDPEAAERKRALHKTEEVQRESN